MRGRASARKKRTEEEVTRGQGGEGVGGEGKSLVLEGGGDNSEGRRRCQRSEREERGSEREERGRGVGRAR